MDTDEPAPPAEVPAPVEPTPAPVPVPEPEPQAVPSSGVHARDEVDEPVAKRVKVDEVAPVPVEAPAVVDVLEPVIDEPAVEPAADVVEEEEPPVYEFEPEDDSGRPTDMYLDTVRSSRMRSRHRH